MNSDEAEDDGTKTRLERTARQQLGALNVPISALDVIDE